MGRDLTPRISFGREGEGPGELVFPQDIAAFDRRLYLSDVSTGRVTVSDEQGTVITDQMLPSGSDQARIAVTGSGVLAAALTDSIARVATAADGSWTYRGEGRARHAPLTSHDGPPATFRRVAGGRADTVYLFEDQIGEIVAISATGRARSVARLPESMMASLAERSRAALVSLVGEEIARTSRSSYFRSFSSAPDGTLTALFALDGVVGVVIDPATGAVSRLLVGDDPQVQAVVREARAGVVHRDTLFLLSSGGVHLIGVR